METQTGALHTSTTAESRKSSCMEGNLYFLMTINIRDPSSLKLKNQQVTKVIVDKLIGLLSEYLASLTLQVMDSMPFFLCPLIQFVSQFVFEFLLWF